MKLSQMIPVPVAAQQLCDSVAHNDIFTLPLPLLNLRFVLMLIYQRFLSELFKTHYITKSWIPLELLLIRLTHSDRRPYFVLN